MLFVGAGVTPSISGIITDGNDSTVHNDASTVLRLLEPGKNRKKTESIATSSFDHGLQCNPAINDNIMSNDNDKISRSIGNSDQGWKWAERLGGVDWDEGLGVAVDSSGVYITGYFYGGTGRFAGTATFDDDKELITQGGTDVFVAKLDPDGEWVWAKSGGGTGHDWGMDVAVDSSGVYITGYFYGGTAIFGDDELIPQGTCDVFVAKLDTDDGEWVWAVSGGPTSIEDDDRGHGVAVNSSGVYITGFFEGTAKFGSHPQLTRQEIDGE